MDAVSGDEATTLLSWGWNTHHRMSERKRVAGLLQHYGVIVCITRLWVLCYMGPRGWGWSPILLRCCWVPVSCSLTQSKSAHHDNGYWYWPFLTLTQGSTWIPGKHLLISLSSLKETTWEIELIAKIHWKVTIKRKHDPAIYPPLKANILTWGSSSFFLQTHLRIYSVIMGPCTTPSLATFHVANGNTFFHGIEFAS